MAAASSSFSSMPEMSESNNMLLMALMEETQEDHENYIADARLMNMILSLEAEISSTRSANDDEPCPSYDMEVGLMDDQDFSTSSSPSSISYSSSNWDDMEVVSDSSISSSFNEEMMNAWSLCAAGGDDSTYDYYDSSEFYYNGVLLENYLPPQEANDLVF